MKKIILIFISMFFLNTYLNAGATEQVVDNFFKELKNATESNNSQTLKFIEERFEDKIIVKIDKSGVNTILNKNELIKSFKSSIPYVKKVTFNYEIKSIKVKDNKLKVKIKDKLIMYSKGNNQKITQNTSATWGFLFSNGILTVNSLEEIHN